MSFINTIKTFFSFLVNTGTDDIRDEETVNRIKNVNKLSIAFAIALLGIGPTISYLLHWSLAVIIPVTIEFIINSSVISLNRRKKFIPASLILYYLQCTAIIYFDLLFGQLLQLQFTIVFLILITFLIFKETLTRALGLAAAVLCLGVIEYGNYKDIHFAAVNLTPGQAYIIHILVIVAVFAIIMFVSKPYFKSNDSTYELKRANHFIKIFTAQVTHELRTPLNTIHQIGQMLKKDVKKNEHLSSIEPLVEMSLMASTQARNIINNVLTMAEIESGVTEKIGRESFVVESFFSKIVEVNKVIAQMEHIKLKFSIEGMPDVIVSDPLNLNQIATNLLANAIKYGDKDSAVTLKIGRQEDKWTLQVINRGPFITPEQQASIFDPFTTGKNCFIEGTGLGLYIVRNKVAAMNGTIQVVSTPLRYTTFTVTLPLVEGKLRNVPVEEDDSAEESNKLQGKKILIAEDNGLSAIMLKKHVNDLGCKGSSVGNGLELLQSAERDMPDIIIMDYHMPVMDGEETIHHLKKNPLLRHIPVIVSTGDLFAESLERILAAGAETYIEKPIDIQTLKKTICRYLPKTKKSE
jgi:signal transduction histidine kinase/ActR/RegA family two-component response regulator